LKDITTRYARNLEWHDSFAPPGYAYAYRPTIEVESALNTFQSSNCERRLNLSKQTMNLIHWPLWNVLVPSYCIPLRFVNVLCVLGVHRWREVHCAMN